MSRLVYLEDEFQDNSFDYDIADDYYAAQEDGVVLQTAIQKRKDLSKIELNNHTNKQNKDKKNEKKRNREESDLLDFSLKASTDKGDEHEPLSTNNSKQLVLHNPANDNKKKKKNNFEEEEGELQQETVVLEQEEERRQRKAAKRARQKAAKLLRKQQNQLKEADDENRDEHVPIAEAAVDEVVRTNGGGRSTVRKKTKASVLEEKGEIQPQQQVDSCVTATTSTAQTLDIIPDASAETAPSSLPLVLPVAGRSSWLRKFLSQKREPGAIEPKPLVEPLSDEILKGFFSESVGVGELNNDVGNGKKQDDEEEDDEAVDGNRLLFLPSSSRVLSSDVVDPSRTIDEDPISAASDKTVLINMFNLPYSVSESDILALAEDINVKVTSITIKMDKKKNLPAGAVSIEVIIEDGIDIDTVLGKLREREMGGRKPRAELGGSNRRSRPSGSGDSIGRYWGTDITCKCFLCGEVGHKSNDCCNPPLSTPCSLCAGLDHDSQACPNIICYRCGSFGHHSRSCRELRMSKAAVCTFCGNTTHDARVCSSERSKALLRSRFEGDSIVCMSCGNTGHLCCQRKPELSSDDKRIFCYNCGQEGHHIEATSGKDVAKLCKAPKNDAYVKFPSLLGYDVSANNMRANNEVYRSLIQSSNYFYEDLTLLFPSIAAEALLISQQQHARKVSREGDATSRRSLPATNIRGGGEIYEGNRSRSSGRAVYPDTRHVEEQPYSRRRYSAGNNSDADNYNYNWRESRYPQHGVDSRMAANRSFEALPSSRRVVYRS